MQFILTKSIPFVTITYVIRQKNISDAAVAQSVERRIGSAEVTGPIPVSSLKTPLIGVFLRSEERRVGKEC